MTHSLRAAPRCPALTWRVPWSSSSRVGLLAVASGPLVQDQVHVREDGAKQCGTRGWVLSLMEVLDGLCVWGTEHMPKQAHL